MAVARVDTPARPAIGAGTMWAEAYLIDNPGHQNSLGWQNARKIGRCFVLGRRGSMGGVKVVDRFPLTEDGWTAAWAALCELDAQAASSLSEVLQRRAAAHGARLAEKERQEQMYQLLSRQETVSLFPALGVQVIADDDRVYTIGVSNPAAQTDTSRLLGALSGAQAMVTDGSQAWSPGRAMFMPIGLAGLATKTKADAAIVFTDGTVHTSPLDGNAAVRYAQLQVVQFNALAGAGAAAPVAVESPGDHVARLRALQQVRDCGLISDEEYQNKRAEIMSSI